MELDTEALMSWRKSRFAMISSVKLPLVIVMEMVLIFLGDWMSIWIGNESTMQELQSVLDLHQEVELGTWKGYEF